ncbi:hypothetical protein CPB84DRAFT_1462765 [Gymnopilus junonius]|uniref:Uncharacterized protein n=1 Tax=Gymnopilus junonius TaxID=109634 RepID=A0A9P5TKH6_GYMJU|nr:hypothetical protein CPB84DRAFT_1462765 [Gymnopilus junonius]
MQPPKPSISDNTTIIDDPTRVARASSASNPEFELLASPSMMDVDTTVLPGSDTLLADGDENSSRPKKSRMAGGGAGSAGRRAVAVPSCLPINLGTYQVNTIELWTMGSFGPRGEYVSCGGIELE